jgi:TonB family protein
VVFNEFPAEIDEIHRLTPLCLSLVLSVAADGTVANVAIRQSSGYSELDARAQKWMKRWRFKPNSLTEVQLPMFFTETYRREW